MITCRSALRATAFAALYLSGNCVCPRGIVTGRLRCPGATLPVSVSAADWHGAKKIFKGLFCHPLSGYFLPTTVDVVSPRSAEVPPLSESQFIDYHIAYEFTCV
jgi:hypothetical protein